MKEYRNGMVARNLPFQWISDIITRWESKKLNENKRLNTHIWYDEKNLNWIKATFDKNGKWEYKLLKLEN